MVNDIHFDNVLRIACNIFKLNEDKFRTELVRYIV